MIIYGKNAIKSCIANKHEIYKLYLDQKFNDNKFLLFLKDYNIYYEQIPKDKLNQMTNNGIHQGVVADIAPYKSISLKEYFLNNKPNHLVILDQISDPQNLGSIVRTTNALGLNGIIINKTNQAPINGVCAKIASGALEYVKIIEVTNINQTIIYLKSLGYTVIGSSDKASMEYRELPKEKLIALVVGSEGLGIRRLVLDNCDYLVKIPMYGNISSLNVGVAFGILGYGLFK